MSLAAVTSSRKDRFATRARKWVATGAVGALLAATFTVVGVGSAPVEADVERPTVEVEQPETLVLGEDLTLHLTLRNDASATHVYNLSVAALLPEDVAFVSAGAPLGAPTEYEAGDVLPGVALNGESCTVLGLEAASPPSTGCAVPAGTQYWVWENVSDLPAKGVIEDVALTVRPDAEVAAGDAGFAVGDEIPVAISAYTSNDERYLPVFPGGTGLGSSEAQDATSGRGDDDLAAPVKALRITKSEPSPEEELLRGVHDNSTLYTLTIEHTGEGDLSGATVVDFLPAGLEFLGCGNVDNTTNANGNRGGASSVEYDGAARLDDATPDVSSCVAADAVVTVEADSALLAQYPDAGLVAGDVYTMVTWNVGTWLQSSGGVVQAADLSAAGVAGTTTIQYRAAVPLFENTLDFGYTLDTTGQQTANLDNNRGASTRHGVDSDSYAEDATAATSYTNVATASGTWQGAVSTDSDWETVDAVDVRVLKSVRIGDYSTDDTSSGWDETASFEKGQIANYRMTLSTSEYVSADMSASTNYIEDELANGLCPVYPSADVAADGMTFAIKNADGTLTTKTAEGFNQELTAKDLGACTWEASNFTTEAMFSGAKLVQLSFDPATGVFTQKFALEPGSALASENSTANIIYSARQNEAYIESDNRDGAVSSGDTVENHVQLELTTTARDEVKDLTNSGDVSAGDTYAAWDDSAATVTTKFSSISKWILDRSQSSTSVADLIEADHGSSGSNTWLENEDTPFAVGDKVWFKISYRPAEGTDVRNPVLTDFLPEGVEFDKSQLDATNQWQNSDNFRVYATADDRELNPSSDLPTTIGDCTINTVQDGYEEFVGAVDVSDDGRKLTWNLGSSGCFPSGSPSQSGDRFWPTGYGVDIYIQATVTDADAFGAVDLTENLAKYQQNNVDGEVYFERDAAGMTLDTSAKLVKGIADINDEPTVQNAWNSNVDASTSASSTVGQVVQDDQVTFRLDVTAPVTDTSDYVILDALPEGILAADLAGYNSSDHTITASGSLWSGTTVNTMTPAPTAKAYDWADLPPDLEVNSAYNGRTIVVWNVSADIPGSSLASESVSAIERGFSLFYTVEVPDGTAGAAAQITQQYVNVASIQQFDYKNASGGTSTVVPTLDGATTAATGADWNGGAAQIAPVSSKTADTGAGEYPITADKATDPSRIKVPGATIDKTLIETEIKPADDARQSTQNTTTGTDDVITQGEYATFDYSVEIPANTTVVEGVLSDDGVFRRGSASYDYEFVSATATVPDGLTVTNVTSDPATPDATNFTFNTETGKLTFPASYTNATSAAQTFTVRITVWMDDADASNPSYTPNLGNNWLLTNTARFSFENPNNPTARVSTSDTAAVTYREPNLGITKTASPASGVTAGDTVTYTIAVTNANRVISYDNVVVDTVPAGLLIDENSFKIGTSSDYASATPVSAGADNADAVAFSTAGLTTGDGGTITWSYDKTDLGALGSVPSTAYLFYQAKIDPSTGAAQTYTNEAKVTGHTLPSTLQGDPTTRRGDRTADDDATITAATAAIEKGVRIAGTTDAYAEEVSAPVGETVQYQVVIDLQANINYYDPKIIDDLPAGAALQTATISGPTASDGTSTITGTWTRTEDTSTNTHTWTYDGDILSATTKRTLTLTYEVLLSNAIGDAVTDMPNTASFTWNRVNDNDATSTSLTDDANVDLLDPVMAIVKKVDGEDAVTREVDDTFDYAITVTNTGDTPAYNVVVKDDVPAGVKVDTTTITPTPTSVDASVSAGTGGTITWKIDGPIDVSTGSGTTQVVLTYEAGFTDSTNLDDDALVNTANVTHFESFDDGGRNYNPPLTGTGSIRDTASVTPLFPNVVPKKTVTNPVAGETYGIAYVGEAFGWTLEVENTGTGTAKDVSVTDELPENWEYVAGSAKLIVGTGAPQPLGDPTVTGTTTQTLTWSESQLSSATPTAATPLAAGASFTITFDAKPTAAATTTPGTGIEVNAHTNTLSVTATDEQDNDHNDTGDYVGPDSTAEAYIAEADLKLEKTTLGGVAAVQNDPTAPLYGVPVDTWVAGQSVVAGVYDQPQWQITITNQGPDASYGPFELVDTTTLPAGVTTGTWSAVYYASASDTTGTALTMTGAGTSADPYVIGGTGTSLKADGSDRIELVANVTIDATATGTAENVASVTGRTFEDPTNLDDNENNAEKSITTAADLGIVKTIIDPVSPAIPNAGDTITWELTVTNYGPSASVSTTANPIVITDTVPTGMTGVTATSNTDWVATLADGSPIPAEGVDEGTEILWTYQGSTMPVGTTAAVQLTGTIATSFTGTLANTAEVEPGDTPDNAPLNNESTVDVDPDDSTTVSITKTRVVWDATTSSWVNATSAVVWGDQVSYRIDVANNGPADARDVQVVDETPAGFVYDSKTDVTGTWTRTAGGTTSTGTDSEWDTFALTGTLPDAETRSFVVTYSTDPNGTGTVENWAETTIDNWDPTDPGDRFDRDDDSSDSTRVVDLGIVKSHTGTGTFTAGETVEYTLVVTNHGPSTTNGVIEIEDALPAGMSYVPGSAEVTVPAGTATPTSSDPILSGTDSRVLTWSLLAAADTFAPTETITITFDVLIDASVRAEANLENAAQVDGPDSEPTPDPHSNRDTDEVTTDTEATMTIDKTVADGPYVAGTQVQYTLTVTNSGPSEAPASVTDTLPTGLTLVSISGTGWDCPDDAAVAGAARATCAYTANGGLHPVGSGAATTLSVTALIDAAVVTGTQLTNTAELTWTDSRGSHTDDDDADITVTTSADLALVKKVKDAQGNWVDSAEVTAGTAATFQLAVSNLGTSNAIGPVTVTDTLPAGMTFQALTGEAATAWTAEVDADNPQQVTFTLLPDTAGVAAGAAAPAIEFTALVDANLPATATPDVPALTNTATAASGTPDPNLDNNTDSADVVVVRAVDLAIVKTHAADDVRIGETLAFTLTVTNNGPSAATGVTVTDTVPAGLDVTTAPGDPVGEGWTIISVEAAADGSGTVITAVYSPELAAGVTAPALTLATAVTANAYPGVTNTADVTGTEPETNPEDNHTEDPVTVPPLSLIEVTKTAKGTFQVGKTAMYSITATNSGLTADPGPITVTDTLPAGLTYVETTLLPDGVSVAVGGQTVTWTIEDGLAVGQTVEIGLKVLVGQAAYPSVTNTVVVDSPSEQMPSTGGGTDSVTTPVKDKEPLSVTGVDPAGVTGAAVFLMLLGGGLLVAAKRRRKA